jgi:uncharacterized protein YdaT
MPWTPDEAPSHTKKAATEQLRRLWAEVANKILEETGDEGRAIREANAVVARARHRGDMSSG